MSWETLRVGDFITVYRDKFHRESMIVYDGYSSREVDVPPVEYSGVPSEILGIALPFIAIRNIDTGNHYTIDLRRWDVQICTREYAKVFIPEDKAYIPKKGKTLISSSKDKADTGLCPMCNEKMISFRPERIEYGYSNWSMRCKKCKIECREYK